MSSQKDVQYNENSTNITSTRVCTSNTTALDGPSVPTSIKSSNQATSGCFWWCSIAEVQLRPLRRQGNPLATQARTMKPGLSFARFDDAAPWAQKSTPACPTATSSRTWRVKETPNTSRTTDNNQNSNGADTHPSTGKCSRSFNKQDKHQSVFSYRCSVGFGSFSGRVAASAAASVAAASVAAASAAAL